MQVMVLSSCLNGEDQTNDAPIADADPIGDSLMVSNSFELPPIFTRYDCATCHKIYDKMEGPSYENIAIKYHDNPDAPLYLSKKIVQGGSGVWGNVPMNAHPYMPNEDAIELATYILSLYPTAPAN